MSVCFPWLEAAIFICTQFTVLVEILRHFECIVRLKSSYDKYYNQSNPIKINIPRWNPNISRRIWIWMLTRVNAYCEYWFLIHSAWNVRHAGHKNVNNVQKYTQKAFLMLNHVLDSITTCILIHKYCCGVDA